MSSLRHCLKLLTGLSLAASLLGPALAWCATDRQALLWKAAETGNRADIARAINSGAAVNAQDADGWSALMFAAAAGESGAVNALLQAHANPNLETRDGQTPLMGAVVAGSYDAVRALISAGANRAARTNTGKTAEMLASEKGRTDIVALVRVTESAIPPNVTSSRMAALSPGAMPTAEFTGPGLDAYVIRTFLVELEEARQQREAAQKKEQAAAKRSADATMRAEAARSQAMQVAQARYDACTAAVSTCENECHARGTKSSVAGFVNALPSALKGQTNMGAMNQLAASEDDEHACANACSADRRCEELKP